MKFLIILGFLNLIVITCNSQSQEELEYMKNYEKRITLNRIDDVYIPMDTEDAMKELDRLTEEEARKKIITVPEDSIASKLHFSLGRWMLIHWGMEAGSRISHYYKLKGISTNDDKIDLLIRCFYRHIAGQALDEEKLIKHYLDKQAEEMKIRKSKAKVIGTLGPNKKHNE